MREISQGLAPECANSTIFCRVESGNGLPFTYTPPNWLIPLWPAEEQPNNALWLIDVPWLCIIRSSIFKKKKKKNKIKNHIKRCIYNNCVSMSNYIADVL